MSRDRHLQCVVGIPIEDLPVYAHHFPEFDITPSLITELIPVNTYRTAIRDTAALYPSLVVSLSEMLVE